MINPFTAVTNRGAANKPTPNGPENKSQRTRLFTILLSPWPSLFPDVRLARWKETLAASWHIAPKASSETPFFTCCTGPLRAWEAQAFGECLVCCSALPASNPHRNKCPGTAWAFPYWKCIPLVFPRETKPSVLVRVFQDKNKSWRHLVKGFIAQTFPQHLCVSLCAGCWRGWGNQTLLWREGQTQTSRCEA